MALTVKVGKKAGELDELPEDETIEVEGADVVDNQDELLNAKLEAAELRGQLKVLKGDQPNGQNSHAQIKQAVFNDANSLSDEDFQTKYRMAKHMATASVLEREGAMTKSEMKQELAEARAASELSGRYGSEYYKHKDKIEETLADLSPEVRQDSKRLAVHMERVYKSLAIDRPKPKTAAEKEEVRRRMTPDFEKPTIEAGNGKDKDENADKDEIEEAYRPLAKAVGLSSETERRKYKAMIDGGEFVPMELGGGVTFSDPVKGFERVAAGK